MPLREPHAPHLRGLRGRRVTAGYVAFWVCVGVWYLALRR